MKKIIINIYILVFAVNIYAQSDSILIKEKEIIDKYMEEFDHKYMEEYNDRIETFSGAYISWKKYKNDSLIQMKILV